MNSMFNRATQRITDWWIFASVLSSLFSSSECDSRFEYKKEIREQCIFFSKSINYYRKWKDWIFHKGINQIWNYQIWIKSWITFRTMRTYSSIMSEWLQLSIRKRYEFDFFNYFFSLLKQFDFIIWKDWLMRWITHQQWTINLLMIITRIHPMKIRTNHPIIINKTFLQQRNHWWTHYSFRTHSERILFDLLLLH